jgi:CubicO group peptidase (beta-lactamase class C family)
VLVPERDIIAVLSEGMPTLVRRHQVPGAQLAIRHAGRAELVVAGTREYGTGRPVTRDTAFPIGSISKFFTATAAMVLVADGDLELDVPIGDYLPDLDSACAPITLRQLLSHTSGLGSGPTPGTRHTATLRRYVADQCQGENVVLAPGTGFSYSNSGFVVVGHLLEVVTGMDYWEALESILLHPLGITPTFVNDPRSGTPERPVAAGYSVNLARHRTRPVDQSLAPAEAPAGGLATSAADLVTLAGLQLARARPGLLPAGYAEQMRRAVPLAEPFGLATGWGLGLAIFAAGDTEWYGHDGNSNGTSCYLRFNPALDLAIALTSNANTGLGVWQDLFADLAAAGIPVERPAIQPASPAPGSCLPACVGTYANGEVRYEVRADDEGQLHLAVDGAVFARLICQADLTFALHLPTSGQQLFCGRFLRDPATGAVDRIQVSGRLARRTAGASGDGHRPSRLGGVLT